ncbi:hypothetical protein [Rhodovulum strictum]|uniref:Uncharacterized protein n=1 Tax=Rhodovulum strictum TaxID=58314 RepID=A0A844BEM2_9RHOB|nr:hypothetical protein [Rhodovulum strictum]MRH19765.1 hypothetical protein [Rhodovulum strictum]
MIVTIKALAAMLSPPSAQFKAATWDIADAMLVEDLLTPEVRRQLLPLLDEIHEMELGRQQERFAAHFQRSRSLSLNLIEHLPTDEAGPAAHLDSCHLALLLDTLADRPLNEVRGVLADVAPVVEILALRLEALGSSYAGVFRALLHLAVQGARTAHDAEGYFAYSRCPPGLTGCTGPTPAAAALHLPER